MQRAAAGFGGAVLTALLSSALGVGPGRAQPLDHLQCFQVKADTKVKGRIDTQPLESQLPAGADCRIRGPVLFCTPVRTQNVRVDPPPAGAPDGPVELDHLCYKARCRVPSKPEAVSTDAFGTFDLALRRSKLVCTPAVQGGPIPCGDSDAPQCSGACPEGQVCASFPGTCVSGACSGSIVCSSDSLCSSLCGGVCSFAAFCECSGAP